VLCHGPADISACLAYMEAGALSVLCRAICCILDHNKTSDLQQSTCMPNTLVVLSCSTPSDPEPKFQVSRTSGKQDLYSSCRSLSRVTSGLSIR